MGLGASFGGSYGAETGAYYLLVPNNLFIFKIFIFIYTISSLFLLITFKDYAQLFKFHRMIIIMSTINFISNNYQKQQSQSNGHKSVPPPLPTLSSSKL
jgi:hypothetical protein